MTIKIVCPVCDRPGVVEDICPTCKTDLTLIRGLMDLPVSPVTPLPSVEQKSAIPLWLILTAITFFTIGILLGGVGVYWPLQNKISQLELLPSPTPSPTITVSPPPQACNKGFEYVVRRGDSLSLLALRFYGDAQKQTLILKANPRFQGKEDFLEIGDKLLVPNPNNQCL